MKSVERSGVAEDVEWSGTLEDKEWSGGGWMALEKVKVVRYLKFRN